MEPRLGPIPYLCVCVRVRVCACVCLLCFTYSVVSDSLRPHGPQPSRPLCPWDAPGKNTGVGCHALLQGDLPKIEPKD